MNWAFISCPFAWGGIINARMMTATVSDQKTDIRVGVRHCLNIGTSFDGWVTIMDLTDGAGGSIGEAVVR
jgi:hypothetical protein